MAIPISNLNNNVIDRSDNKFVGLKLPLKKSDGIDGYFESNKLTYDEVKFNIINLIKTKKNERVFQPDLGLGLDRFLFENITDETKSMIEDEIKTAFTKWMPFVGITDISISTIDDNISDKNKLFLKLTFFINNNSRMLDSVEVVVE
tara:strand:+ start:837 stop:1277 length:441 start_codon:yes stop_codon:yes gene_type:complete